MGVHQDVVERLQLILTIQGIFGSLAGLIFKYLVVPALFLATTAIMVYPAIAGHKILGRYLSCSEETLRSIGLIPFAFIHVINTLNSRGRARTRGACRCSFPRDRRRTGRTPRDPRAGGSRSSARSPDAWAAAGERVCVYVFCAQVRKTQP
jgi:hypothetical protein